MIATIHQPEYLPWIGFFSKMLNSDIFVLLDNVQFEKNNFQNRNRVRTKDGWIWLTVPVITKGKSFQRIDEVEIDNLRNLTWQKKHFTALELNYSKAQFFREHKEFFKELYTKPWNKLTELNETIIKYIKEQLELKTRVVKVSELKAEGKSTELLIDILKKLNATTYLSGSHGKGYMDLPRFNEEGISVIFNEFEHPSYKQIYEPFIPAMSIVDMLFTQGKEKSKELLSQTKLK